MQYINGFFFQILHLAHNKSDIERRVHAVIDKFAERGLRSLAVAYQVSGFLDFLFSLFGFVFYSPTLYVYKFLIHSFASCRKFQKESKRVLEARGSLLV